VITLDQIWRYPVKSMRGEEVEACAIGARGLDGDRRYAVIDSQTGRVASAKHPRKWGALLDASARTEGGHVWIDLPDGAVRAPEAASRISAWIGRDVRISDTPSAGDAAEKIDAQSGEQGSFVLGQGAPPGTFFDFGPVHFITTSSLASLGAVDARRFRPNLVLRTSAAGFPEDDWIGRTIAIGGVRLRVIVATPRCVIPTLAHGALAPEPSLLKSIARAHSREVLGQSQPCAGAYAIVTSPGEVRVGDEAAIV